MNSPTSSEHTVIYGEKGANISFRIMRYALISCLPLLAVCAYVSNFFVMIPVLLLIVSRYMTAKYWKDTPYIMFKGDLFTVKPSKMATLKSIRYEDVVSIEEQKRAWSVDYTVNGKEKQLVIVKFWLTPAGEERVRAAFERHFSGMVATFKS